MLFRYRQCVIRPRQPRKGVFFSPPFFLFSFFFYCVSVVVACVSYAQGNLEKGCLSPLLFFFFFCVSVLVACVSYTPGDFERACLLTLVPPVSSFFSFSFCFCSCCFFAPKATKNRNLHEREGKIIYKVNFLCFLYMKLSNFLSFGP